MVKGYQHELQPVLETIVARRYFHWSSSRNAVWDKHVATYLNRDAKYDGGGSEY
jgi:hypothetical protein